MKSEDLKNKNKRKIIIFFFTIFLVILLLLFSYFYMVKNKKIGYNKTSQEMVEEILNIKTYEAIIEVDVKSNKNENKYVIKQEYKGENENSQEVLEPSNIKGVKITKKDDKLKLENTNLNLVSIFENYQYLSENHLDLDSFIKDYKESENSKYRENQEEIIMETSSKEDSKIKKSLYINKKTEEITKLEIEDTNKKTTVYILYREVNVNSK